VNPQTDSRYTPTPRVIANAVPARCSGKRDWLDRREEIVRRPRPRGPFSAQRPNRRGGCGVRFGPKRGKTFSTRGSTTITQVQGLRRCRNAGIPGQSRGDREKPRITSSRAKKRDGGSSYKQSKPAASRPAITAAALAPVYKRGRITTVNTCARHARLQ